MGSTRYGDAGPVNPTDPALPQQRETDRDGSSRVRIGDRG
jgi:hypothetical protein